MIVNINNTYIDLSNYRCVEATAKAIPFVSGTIFRKLKPSTKLKRKVRNTWIGSSRLSLEYLMACYMIENEKEKIACFISLPDSRYFVIEFVITQTPASIHCSGSFIRESPQDYIEIENKVFDEILGNVSIANAGIDFQKLLKYAKTSIDLGPRNIAVLAAGIAVIIGSIIFTVKMVLPPKEPVQVMKQAESPPPLSNEEKMFLNNLIFRDFIEKYNRTVRLKNPDTVLNNLKFNVNAGDQSVRGDLYIEYRSYYPYRGAVLITDRDVDFYQWTENISIEKKRDDIKEKPAVSLPYQCLKKAIDDNWTVLKREEQKWHITVIEKDYKKFISKVNALVGCPVTVNSIEMGGEYKCSLILNL